MCGAPPPCGIAGAAARGAAGAGICCARVFIGGPPPPRAALGCVMWGVARSIRGATARGSSWPRAMTGGVCVRPRAIGCSRTAPLALSRVIRAFSRVRLGEWQKLIWVKSDTSAEWCLKQTAIRRRSRSPCYRSEMSGEHLWIVSSALSDLIPNLVFHAPDIDFCVENRLKSIALRIVVYASQTEGFCSIFANAFNDPLPTSKLNQCSYFRFAAHFRRHVSLFSTATTSAHVVLDGLTMSQLPPNPARLHRKSKTVKSTALYAWQ
jgi:hypothetical protein